MSRIQKIFAEKKSAVLNIYFTAGFPEYNSTMEVLKSLQDCGADMVEIGIPYSDPIADGPVIQQSNSVSLKNGMTIQKLFDQLKDVRHEINIPLLLMGYLNPVMQFGIENFCRNANEIGIDGIILPDLPMLEFENQYKEIFERYDLDFIFLITPETSEERIRKIDQLSKGFIYAVSSSATTGYDPQFISQEEYFKKIQKMNLKNPVLVGFGIKDNETFSRASKYTQGAIIGTAYIRSLQGGSGIMVSTKSFINKILNRD